MPEQIDIAVVGQDLASKVFNAIGEAMKGTLEPGEAVGQVLRVVAIALREAADQAVDYASEVRKMMQLTSQTAEESSKVIQVMDDYKVSTQALTMAQKTLSKDGLSLSIDTLADLSDEYKSLGNSADKTRFLIDHFGRSGLDMAEAMEQGGKAIRAASDAVDSSLVLNQKAIEQAREYERQVDNLNDAWKAFSINVGQKVIPALTAVISSSNLWQEAAKEAAENTGLSRMELEALTKKIYEQKQAQYDATEATREASGAMKDNAMSAADMEQAQKDAAEAAKSMTSSYNDLFSTIQNMQSAETTYQENGKKLTEERAKLEAEKAELRKQGWSETSEKIKDVDKALADNTVALQKNAEEYTKKGNQIVWDLVKSMFLADGVMTQQEAAWLMENGKNMGLFSDQVAEQALKIMGDASLVATSINEIPSEKTITLNFVTNGESTNGAWRDPTHGHATGGSFMIPQSYGYEGFNLGGGHTASGGEMVTVTPKGKVSSGGSGGSRDDLSKLISTLERTMRSNQIDYNKLARITRDAVQAAGG